MEQEIYGKTADLNCEIEVNSNGMMDMSALSGSGIEVDLYGSDLNDLAAAGKQVMALMEGIDGIQNVTDGQDAGAGLPADRRQADDGHHRHDAEGGRRQLQRRYRR